MKKNIFIVLTIVLVLGLLVILVVKKNKDAIRIVNFDEIEQTLQKNVEGLVYVSSTKENPPHYDYFKNSYKISTIKSESSLDKVNNLLLTYGIEKITTLPCFIVYSDGKPIGTFDGTLNETKSNEMFRYVFFNELPSDMIYYKTLSTADEYIKKVNSNKLTVAVFGYDECSYCNLYKPVFNKVAKDKNLDIYYFDSNKYDFSEYDKIMSLDLKIPAECTTDGKDTSFLLGFPKPMTIVTKKGELVGCIKGYVPEDLLIEKLKKFKVLKG